MLERFGRIKSIQLTTARNKVHTQYLYSTPTLKEATLGLSSGKTRPPRGKAGETKHEDATVRIKQQDGTSSAEPLELLASREVPDHITDDLVRKTICGFDSPITNVKYTPSRIDADREWIDFHGHQSAEDMVKIWNEAINYLTHGVRAPYDFKPFDYQMDIVDWAMNRFNAGESDLLINAIMRAGKCLITYEIARSIKAKNILIVTAKPGVDDSWAELLPNGERPHVNYINWKYHSYNNYRNKTLELTEDHTNVVFVSLQYVNTHIQNPSTLLSTILNASWDLVAFDEQHYATQTSNTVNIFDALNYRYKIELSGTPYKTLLSGRFSPDNIKNFDYIDEQKIRLSAKPNSILAKAFEFRADINWAMLHVPENVKALIGEEGFTHSKLFATDKTGKFINTPAVVEYVRFVQKKAYKNPPGKFRDIANLNRHTLWVLPDNVAAICAFVQLLESDAYFGKFKIINASGRGVKNIDEVKTIITNVESGKLDHSGTITITCGRFLEGTTVPQWCSVHEMNDDKSAADYFQGAFRCKSSWEAGNKKSVLVYDYNPERCISVIYKHVMDTADRDQGQSNEDRLKEWLAVSDVYDYENDWNLLDGSGLIARANESLEFHSEAFGDIQPDKNAINSQVLNALANLSTPGSKKASATLNSNNITTGSNQTITGTQNSSSIQNNLLDEAVARIKLAIKRLPELIYNTEFETTKINNIEDVCNSKDFGFIKDHTGLTPKEWGVIIKALPPVQKDRLNRRIDALIHSGVLDD